MARVKVRVIVGMGLARGGAIVTWGGGATVVWPRGEGLGVEL